MSMVYRKTAWIVYSGYSRNDGDWHFGWWDGTYLWWTLILPLFSTRKAPKGRKGRWERVKKTRWTHRLIPSIKMWTQRTHVIDLNAWPGSNFSQSFEAYGGNATLQNVSNFKVLKRHNTTYHDLSAFLSSKKSVSQLLFTSGSPNLKYGSHSIQHKKIRNFWTHKASAWFNANRDKHYK